MIGQVSEAALFSLLKGNFGCVIFVTFSKMF